MRPYWVKTPTLLQSLFPNRIWRLPNDDNAVYLTFDDGPIPEVTPWVLDTLKKYDAKATFFCIGDNVTKHKEVFNRVISQGHSIGNHTFHHLNGWNTAPNTYVEDTLKAEGVIHHHQKSAQKLFRPPYGKMTSKQAKKLQELGYKIIMWDILSADFDSKVSEEQCLKNVIQHITPGSIVIFHDSIKAKDKLYYALPKVLEFISEKGWKCRAID